MKEVIFYIEESFDGGYEAKAIGHAIFTHGETIEEIRENIKDSVKCHFDEKDMPNLIKLHFIKDEAIAI
jgi:hypothetical protein